MKRARAIALARRHKPDPVPWFVWLALFMAVGIACASAQSVQPGTDQEGGSGATTVLRPPNVDPGMAKTPPAQGFPTPVMRPRSTVPVKPVPLPSQTQKPPRTSPPSQPPG